jgi:glutathione S-transferase
MVLHEKGIDFEVHEVDLSNKSEDFLSVSPYGKVPVLSVNGTSLYESNIVNEYLEEVYDSPRLMPENPEEREHRYAPGWLSRMITFSLLSTGFAWGRSEGTQKMRFKRLKRSSTMCSHV